MNYHEEDVTSSSTSNHYNNQFPNLQQSTTNFQQQSDDSSTNPKGLSFIWGGNEPHDRRPSSSATNHWRPQQSTGNSSTFVQEESTMSVWTNPNAKKKSDVDRGTAVWGDPSRQGPIRRWRQVASEAVILPPEKPPSSSQKQQQKGITNDENSSSMASSSTTITTSNQQQQSNIVEMDQSAAKPSTAPSVANQQDPPIVPTGWGQPSKANEVQQPQQQQNQVTTRLIAGGWEYGVDTSKQTDQQQSFANAYGATTDNISRPPSAIGSERPSMITAFKVETFGQNGPKMPATDYWTPSSSSGNGGSSYQMNTNTVTNALAKLCQQVTASQPTTSSSNVRQHEFNPQDHQSQNQNQQRAITPPSAQATTHYLADLLRRAIAAGYLDESVMQRKLSIDQLERLQSCLHTFACLERAKNVHAQVSYASLVEKQQDYERIWKEQENLACMMSELRSNIQQQQQPTVARSIAGQSKLEQWKRGPTPSNLENDPGYGSASSSITPPQPIVSGLIDGGLTSQYQLVSSSMWSTSTVYNSSAAWPTTAWTSSAIGKKRHQSDHHVNEQMDAADDAAITAVVDDLTSDPHDDMLKPHATVTRTSTPIGDEAHRSTNESANKSGNTTLKTASSINSTSPHDLSSKPKNNNNNGKKNKTLSGGDRAASKLSSTIAPTFDATVPEFKPGQPWMWRDPKELAQDPEATPASFISKKPAFYSNSSATATPPSIVGSGSSTPSSNMFNSTSSAGQLITFEIAGKVVNSVENKVNSQQANAYFGLLSSNPTTPSAASSSNTRSSSSAWTKQPSSQDVWPSSVIKASTGGGVTSHMAQMRSAMGIAGGMMPQQSTSIQSQRLPYASMKPGMPAGGPTANQFVMPYSALVPGYSTAWVVLTSLTMDDQQLQVLLSTRYAPLSSWVPATAAGFVAFRFKDVPLEKILPRLDRDFTMMGMTVLLAKDDEINQLVQCVQQPMPLLPASVMVNSALGGGGQLQQYYDLPSASTSSAAILAQQQQQQRVAARNAAWIAAQQQQQYGAVASSPNPSLSKMGHFRH